MTFVDPGPAPVLIDPFPARGHVALHGAQVEEQWCVACDRVVNVTHTGGDCPVCGRFTGPDVRVSSEYWRDAAGCWEDAS